MPPRVGRQRRTTRAKPEASDSSGSRFHNSLSDTLNKNVAENTAVDLNSEDFVMSSVTEYISTQCYGLNRAMHLPGFAVGRVHCIRGDFMSGKSTIALHLMAETQRMGGFAVYMDTEYAFDKTRAKAVGVNLDDDKWLLVQVDTVEKAVKTLRKTIEMVKEEQDNGNDQLVTIVWDSVGATATEAEMSAEFGEARPGLHARLLSAALRQLTPSIAKYRICLILVNQEKEKMDFFSMGKDTKTMTAEKPIMFHSTTVLRPQHRQTLNNSKKEPTGIRVICTVRKNKLAAPFSKCEFVIDFATGIDNAASVLAVAVEQNIVKKSGAWYSYDGKKFYERDFAKIMADHPEIMEELEAISQKDGKINRKHEDDEDDGDPAEDEVPEGDDEEAEDGD